MGLGKGYYRTSHANLSVNALEATLAGEVMLSEMTGKTLEWLGLPLKVAQGRKFIKEFCTGIVHHVGSSYKSVKYYDLDEVKEHIEAMKQEEGGIEGYLEYL